jgi:hypothetical protein
VIGITPDHGSRVSSFWDARLDVRLTRTVCGVGLPASLSASAEARTRQGPEVPVWKASHNPSRFNGPSRLLPLEVHREEHLKPHEQIINGYDAQRLLITFARKRNQTATKGERN